MSNKSNITNGKPGPDRRDVLLRAAYDLLATINNSPFTESALGTLVRYDDANCDGMCLMQDIAIELGLEDNEKPTPLGAED